MPMEQGEERMTDAGMLQGLRTGNPAAVHRFVTEFGPRIHGFVRCFVAQTETAEDLTQEVLLRAYQKCSQVNQPDHFVPWLFSLARNVALKEMSRRRYSVETPRENAWFDEREAERPNSPSDRLKTSDRALLLGQALATLEERNRQIMALRYYSGLPLKEIADIMNIPIGSIGVMIRRSLEALKKYFDSQGLKVEDLL